MVVWGEVSILLNTIDLVFFDLGTFCFVTQNTMSIDLH